MKKILLLSLILCSFAAKAQNPLVGKPSLKLVFDVAQTKKWDFTVDTNNMLEINGTGGTPSIRLTDFSGTGTRILAVDADGDLVRTTVDPALTTVAGSNTQVQYNNSGVFGASSDFIFNGTNLGVNGIVPVSTSGGLNLRNNAGTPIVVIGVGSTSSTNSTWAGNTVVTGDWDVSGFVEGGNLRITSNTFSSQDANGNIVYSPNGTGINQFTKNIEPSTNGTLSLGASSARWDDIYLAGEIFMINSGGISISPAVQGGNRTYTIPDAGSSTSFMMGASGATNRIPYFSGTSILTNSSNFTYNGSSLGIGNTTNQIVTGAGANLTTLNFPASSGAVTLTFPNTTTTIGTYVSSPFTPVVSDATSGGNTATGTFEGHYVIQNGQATVYISLVNITTAGMTGGNDLFIQLPALLTPITSVGLYNGTCRSGGSNTFTGYLTAGFLTLTNSVVVRENISGAINDVLTVADISSGAGDLFITIQFMIN